jgi:hypothetical protein
VKAAPALAIDTPAPTASVAQCPTSARTTGLQVAQVTLKSLFAGWRDHQDVAEYAEIVDFALGLAAVEQQELRELARAQLRLVR